MLCVCRVHRAPERSGVAVTNGPHLLSCTTPPLFVLCGNVTATDIEALTYGRGPPGPLVNGVRSTPDGVVNLRPNVTLRLRNAVTLLKLLVHAPPSWSLASPSMGQKMKISPRPNLVRRTAPPCRELKIVPETALGHARLARHADLAFYPLDFEDYPRVFKFWIDETRFRDRLFWRDPSMTEAGRRCRIATPSP